MHAEKKLSEFHEQLHSMVPKKTYSRMKHTHAKTYESQKIVTGRNNLKILVLQQNFSKIIFFFLLCSLPLKIPVGVRREPEQYQLVGPTLAAYGEERRKKNVRMQT